MDRRLQRYALRGSTPHWGRAASITKKESLFDNIIYKCYISAMMKRHSSRLRDNFSKQSPLSDSTLSLSEVLRDARQRKQLSQQELARKLGLRQRQISDLERAVSDSRLSTVQNVARALDLELMLISRPLIAVVEALQRTGGIDGKQPLYALNDEPEDIAADTDHVEVGDTSNTPTSRKPQWRARKGSRR
jgi:transcriptional regulator with XRE-family HTH domain